jgi:hypothetical protein
MNRIIKYHSKYLKFITKSFRFDPIALLIALNLFHNFKAIITYMLLVSLIHLPFIIYKNYKKIK